MNISKFKLMCKYTLNNTLKLLRHLVYIITVLLMNLLLKFCLFILTGILDI